MEMAKFCSRVAETPAVSTIASLRELTRGNPRGSLRERRMAGSCWVSRERKEETVKAQAATQGGVWKKTADLRPRAAREACRREREGRGGKWGVLGGEGVEGELFGIGGIVLGILFDGILFDGILFDGILFDGILFDGILSKGILFDGILSKGILFDGILSKGILFDSLVDMSVEDAGCDEIFIRVFSMDISFDGGLFTDRSFDASFKDESFIDESFIDKSFTDKSFIDESFIDES